MFGDLLIRWTARLAVACYAARLICDTGGQTSPSTMRAARWWWTIGCVWFVLHVIAAFHFEHHWDHAKAISDTAKRTFEVTGWKSGSGLYVNEAFLLLWLTDTALWWKNLTWPENRPAYWTVQAIFAFLMIQATAVFGPPLWKAVAVVVMTLLVYRIFKVRHRRDLPQQTAQTFHDPLD